MKTWTNPAVEELEVKMTAGGCLPFLFETCITHGIGCGCPSDPDGDLSDGEVEIPNEGTPS